MISDLKKEINTFMDSSSVDKKQPSEKRLEKVDRKLNALLDISRMSGCIQLFWQRIKKSSDDLVLREYRSVERKTANEKGWSFVMQKQELPKAEKIYFSIMIKKYKKSKQGLYIGLRFMDDTSYPIEIIG